MQEIDGSFALSVDRTPWGDISFTLERADVQIQLDPAEAIRICRDVLTLLGRPAPTAGQAA